MNWIPAEYGADYRICRQRGGGTFASGGEPVAVLQKFEAVGTDEIQLIPTSSDLGQLRRMADVVHDV